MAMIRVKPVVTTTSAQGKANGELTLTTTVGIPRHSILSISKDTGGGPTDGGWIVEILAVVDGTHVMAQYADDGLSSANRKDLTAIPTASQVVLAEQWVPDLYSDDIPDSLKFPVHSIP